MKLLVLDGNSIVNRAFYGIKLLTTKDGKQFTNAIYGFLNILLRLKEETQPDAVAIAFDVKVPTFRHELYAGYKANRKGMPTELAQQMQPLKTLLSALGYRLLEAPGWEADDILGTLAAHCGAADACYIATGDRDSLQLVRENVQVLLASTKMGRPQTVRYDAARIEEEYLVPRPELLIDVKALQGDASDCIPGVAGIGEKTARELVSKYGSIDDIYANLETIDIKKGVHDKLVNDKEMAYLSRTLGTIRTDAPVDCDYAAYVPAAPDAHAVTTLLTSLEMFKMIERLELPVPAQPAEAAPQEQTVNAAPFPQEDLKLLYNRLRKEGKALFLFDAESGVFRFPTPQGVAAVEPAHPDYVAFCTEFLSDAAIEKYTYNCKAIYKFFYQYRTDIDVRAVRGDTMLSAYVLNPSAGDYSLRRVTEEYGGLTMQAEDPDLCTAYLPAVVQAQADAVEANGQTALLAEIELPLAQVLASMEREGFLVDAGGIEAFGREMQTRIDALVASIYAQVGYEFNLNSPKQLGEALFEKLGLPAKKKTKSGYSTNAEVLEGLAEDYPVVAEILEYRTYAKLRSTYCDGLLKEIEEDGRIRSSLNQTETRTGRISSTEPNLQNIPVRSEIGREMRKFFKAAPGCVLVDADYSQIELRVLAAVAQDAAMIEAFANGEDIHTITASQVFRMPPEMVTPLMRSRAKAVNFGIVYGIGAFSLAKDIGVTRAEADQYIKGYLAHFSGVQRYMQTVVAQAKQDGYVSTLFARRRYLPELNASNAMLRAFGERVAMNMPIQGTAADIIKIAMIRVFAALRRECPAAKLIMQVHDELIVEAPADQADRVASLLKREMEQAVALAVPMRADVGVGATWYDAKS
ncbi:MAG: DNA polymerase I [Clostridia bacterium]|nr:DNA polymerase I [Clostridia bacterium]